MWPDLVDLVCTEILGRSGPPGRTNGAGSVVDYRAGYYLIMSSRVLLTGAAGFVGAHALRHLLVNTDYDVLCPVTFRHRGNADRIASSLQDHPEWQQRVTVEMCDLAGPLAESQLKRWGDVDIIVNVASESHVDRSIADPAGFTANNVALITTLLEYARWSRPRFFVQTSTDEVYGPAPRGYAHVEWDAIIPSNPYAASKAAQEAICTAYWRTYGVPLLLTNTMNMFGEMQDQEKFVAMCIRLLARGESVPVHVSPEGEPGSRFYLHARNLADAWLHLMTRDVVRHIDGADRPDRYHVVGEREITNVEMVKLVAEIMHVEPRWHPVDFHSSRPGHDLRYALDGKKLADTGWTHPYSLERSLVKTIEWTRAHPEWL